MRQTGPGPVATAAVGLGFVALFMLITGGLTKLAINAITFRLQAGKRYRFFFLISPALTPNDEATLPIGLKAAGAEDISVATTDNKTVGMYVMTALANKDLVL